MSNATEGSWSKPVVNLPLREQGLGFLKAYSRYFSFFEKPWALSTWREKVAMRWVTSWRGEWFWLSCVPLHSSKMAQGMEWEHGIVVHGVQKQQREQTSSSSVPGCTVVWVCNWSKLP